MANTIYDIVQAPIIAAYWNELASNNIPYLGEAFFPAKKMVGLKLDWIRGKDSLPVMLMPSAFDAQPTLRDRGGVETAGMKMPFFREAMRIGEEDRQQLLQLGASGNAFVNTVIDKLFDDISTLVAGARVIPEVMRMELLQTGTIAIQSPNESGINVNYSYDYDPQSKWSSSNFVTLSGANLWTATGTANPIKDILAVKRNAASRGISLTRAIVGTDVWTQMLMNASLAKAMYPYGNDQALTDGDLTQYIASKTGITFAVYEKQYTGLNGTSQAFMRSDRVVFLPSNAVGSTYFGTTPEEADLMAGASDAQVRVVEGGIAILTKKESLPVNVITSVSEIVLPSYESMDSVFVLKVA